MCMMMQKNVVPSFVQMWPCDEEDDNKQLENYFRQNVIYNKTTGQLISIASELESMKCLTPLSFNEANNAASGLVLEDCVENEDNRKKHLKQRFHYSNANNPRRGSRGRVLTGVQTTMCLALKSSAPLNANTIQMWAKRLPRNAENVNPNGEKNKIQQRAAVFLINADQYKSHNAVFNSRILCNIFQVELLPKGLLRIQDVWKNCQPPNVNNETLEDNFRDLVELKVLDEYLSWSVEIPPRDSQFFIFEIILQHGKQNSAKPFHMEFTKLNNNSKAKKSKTNNFRNYPSDQPEIELI